MYQRIACGFFISSELQTAKNLKKTYTVDREKRKNDDSLLLYPAPGGCSDGETVNQQI